MADLNKELNEYLLSSKNEKQFKITAPSVTIPKANIGKWFSRSEDDKQEAERIQETQSKCCPTLPREQRLVSFFVCFCMGVFCFCMSAIYIPVLLFNARKFAFLYTLGSVSFFLSVCYLFGPLNYIKSLFSAEKRNFSVSYFVTLVGTLYCALHLQSTPLTVLCAVLQLIAMSLFLASNVPGGIRGLMFFTRMFKSSVNSALPV